MRLIFAPFLLAALQPLAAQQIPLRADARLEQLRTEAGTRIIADLVRAKNAQLSPRAALFALSTNETGEVAVDLFVRGPRGIEEGLRALGARVTTRAGDWVTARVAVARLREVAAVPGVRAIEIARRAELMQSTMGEIGVTSLRQRVKRDDFTGATGRGVIVGVVDLGIDFTHADFIDDVTGQSRILFLWDQTLDGFGPGNVGGTTFDFGVECRQTQLGKNGSCQSRDRDGHGSHVTGTAAGDGSAGTPSFVYTGVAPEADIIAVKTDLSAASIVEGVDYIFRRAAQLGRPTVVNLSLGTQLGPHDGNTAISLALDALTGPGKIIVASAGNEGTNTIPASTRSLHAEGSAAVGDSVTLAFVIPLYGARAGSQNDVLLFQAFYPLGDTYTVTVVRPDGSRVQVGYGARTESNSSAGGVIAFNGNARDEIAILGDSLEFGSFFPDAQTNLTEILIGEWVENFSFPGPGEWQVIFRRTGGSSSGLIDAYLPISSLRAGVSFTRGASNRRLIGAIADARTVISVGAYATFNSWEAVDGFVYTYGDLVRVGDLLGFSSPGPTRDGRLKPDITAPGINFSSLSKDSDLKEEIPRIAPDGAHVLLEGTSMASPHVAGAVALLLAVNVKLTPDKVRDALQRSARRDNFTSRTFTGEPFGSPNNSFGFGKLDVPGALALVRAELPNAGQEFNVTQNPVRTAPLIIRFDRRPSQIEIFDFAGKRVRRFELTELGDAQTVRWNLLTDSGANVVNGVYLLVADLPSGVLRRKIFVVR